MTVPRPVWLVALGSLIVVGAFAVSASGVVSAFTPASPSSHSTSTGPGWGPPSIGYNVTFQESGLPANTSWSVAIFGPQGWSHEPAWYQGGGAQNSTNATIGFVLSNGTYSFSVGSPEVSSTIYAPTPAYGNLTVNGTNVTEPVSFSPAALYSVTFSESGLPNGTFWSVSLGGVSPYASDGHPDVASPACDRSTWNGSANSTVNFTEPNGSYSFSIGDVYAGGPTYAAAPANGNVTVNGSRVTVAVTFAPESNYSVTFAETGLPNGTFWSVGLTGASGGGWPVGPTPFSGPTPQCYRPFGWNGSTNSTIGFTVPNGTYAFTVGTPTGNTTLPMYVPSPATGNVTVNGTNVTVEITFTPLVLYNLTFVESGLPDGTDWSAVVFSYPMGWQYNDSANSSIGFYVPNGSYNFSIGAVSNCTATFVPSPGSGMITVNGTGATITVEFTTVTLDNLTFNETGLPNGTDWYVALFAPGQGWFFNSSNNTTVSFLVPNGTYGFQVGIAWGAGGFYNATPAFGLVNVTASNVTVDVSFSFTPVSGGGPPISPEVAAGTPPEHVA